MKPDGSATILVADDDDAVRHVSSLMLTAEGHEVILARDGHEALALARQPQVDAILLDVMMPGMDGLRLTGVLKGQEATKHIPIIVITSQQSREVRAAALEAGADDFLTKPFARVELSVRLRNLLRLKLLRDQLLASNRALEAEVARETAKLRSAELFVRRVFDSTATGVAIVDMSGAIVAVNQAWRDFADENGLGLPGAIVGTGYFTSERSADASAEAMRAGIERVRRNELSEFSLEYTAHTPQRRRWFTARATRFLDGEQIYTVVAHHEITDLKLAEESLRSSETRYRTLLETAPDHVLVIAPDGTVEFSSKQTTELPLRRRMNLFELADPENATGLRHATTVALDTGKQLVFESTWQAAGEPRIVRCRIQRLDASKSAEESAKLLIFATDITLRRHAERALNAMQDHLAESRLEFLQAQKLESLGRLAGGIAHDFANILTTIVGFAELAYDDMEGNEQGRQDLQEVLHAARSATRLTNQLHTLSLSGPVDPATIDLRGALLGLENILRQTVGGEIELTMVLPERETNVILDPSQLDQLLLNLAVNARDAMAEGGKLTIEMFTDDVDSPAGKRNSDHAVIRVADTGVGIPPELLSRVHEPFFSTKGERGTGLGLATCCRIVEQAGGTIEIASNREKGTTFDIRLPLASPGAKIRQSSGTTGAAVSADSAVLLIEDQPRLLRLLSALFQRAGYRVYPAHTAEEALSLVGKTSGPPTAIVADVVLPGMNGIDLLARLRGRLPELPAVLMSGYPDHALVANVQLDEDTRFLLKPFSGAKLLALLADVLAGAPHGPIPGRLVATLPT